MLRLLKLLGVTVACGAVGLVSAAQSNEMILVELDLAKIVNLDEPASTIVLGNPSIADATIFDTSKLVITGKSYGTTNLIVLDANGDEIRNTLVTVRAPDQTLVTVHRGAARASYSCAPTCQPSLVVGDSSESFSTLGDQVSARTNKAESVAE